MAENQEIINITEDGGVIKKILTPGQGEETPSAGNTVRVTYIGTLTDSGKQFDASTNKESPFEFKVGVGQVIKGWDLGMITMKKGERSLFTIQSQYAYGEQGAGADIPPNATLNFEVEMLEWERIKGDYPEEERFKQAAQEKATGNEFFKKGDFQEAKNHYQEAVEWLETMYDKEEAMKDQRVIRNNLAAAFLKLQNYEGASKQTSKILEAEPENEKALFRRGQALHALGDLEQAKNDLKKAYDINNKNNSVIKELQTVQQKIKNKKAEEKKKFGGLFKQSLYDDKDDVKVSKIVDNPSNDSNTRVFMDIKIGESEPERLEIELYDNVVPKTTKNFKELCETQYKGSIFHRNIANFMIQGGDYENRNGTGGKSIYGAKFEDENFNVLHKRRGQLSMANAGPGTNGSQFFILYKDTPHLDGKHVVFGEVSKNIEFLDKLEAAKTGASDKPVEDIVVVDSGVVEDSCKKGCC